VERERERGSEGSMEEEGRQRRRKGWQGKGGRREGGRRESEGLMEEEGR
jgi:hypothetical protein